MSPTRHPACGERRPKPRRTVHLVTALIACLMLAVGCSNSSQPPKADGPLVWAVGGIDAGERGPAFDVAEMWNRRHPNGPKVRVEALPESSDEQRQLMAIELNAGLSGLDILTLDVIWTGEFAERGWLAELQDLRETIEEVSLPAQLESATWNDTLWASPYTSNVGLLYYRSDLVPEAPTSWDELMEVGLEAGRKANIAPFVGQGAQYEGLVVNFLEYFWGAKGDLFDSDGSEVRFHEEPAQRALNFMRKALQEEFYHSGFPDMREEEARLAFQSGEAVFMRNWTYAYRLLNDPESEPESEVIGKFGIAPLPTFDGNQPVAALGGQNLAVSRFSQNAGAAKDFVEFASTDPEVQRFLAQKHGLAPAMASVYDDLSADPLMELVGGVLPTAKPRPPVPEWSAISDEIQQQVFPSYKGNRDPERAVTAIRTFLELTVAEG